jgi:hypothetical protein
MKDKYDPQVGEIWYFETTHKHFLFVSREKPKPSMSSYKWFYKLHCLETGEIDYTYHGNMNAHGEGWFRKVSSVC